MFPPRYVRTLLCALLVACLPALAHAQATPDRAPVTHVVVHALPILNAAKPVAFDPVKATAAYLARVSGKARARSDSYFEGGYVLQVVDALYAIALSALLLWSRFSAWMRNQTQRIVRSKFWQVPVYVVQYWVVIAVLTFPLTVYEAFFREHQYGLSNQNFLQWFGDFATEFGVDLVAALIVLTLIYTAIRATPRYWWLWGAAITVIFFAIGNVITPVFLAPLLNHYTPLPDSPIKREILTLASANGIPAKNIYEFDASRQSNRISANVSGFLGTTQISVTDNLMKQANPREIRAVLGHEMGHYVLDHVVFLIVGFGLVFFAAFAFVHWGFGYLVEQYGGFWHVRTIEDPAGLPALVALATLFFLIATPVTNTITRTVEHQADMFGLNAAREPDGFATAVLKLSTYRKLDPSPLEEFVFYDHPSGHTRIWDAMRWKAGHINDCDIKNGPLSPQ